MTIILVAGVDSTGLAQVAGHAPVDRSNPSAVKTHRIGIDCFVLEEAK